MEINADDSNCSVRAALRTREKIRALVYFHDDNKSYVIKNLRPHIPENATWNTRDTYLVDWAKIKKEESGATIGSPSQFCQMIIVLAAAEKNGARNNKIEEAESKFNEYLAENIPWSEAIQKVEDYFKQDQQNGTQNQQKKTNQDQQSKKVVSQRARNTQPTIIQHVPNVLSSSLWDEPNAVADSRNENQRSEGAPTGRSSAAAGFDFVSSALLFNLSDGEAPQQPQQVQPAGSGAGRQISRTGDVYSSYLQPSTSAAPLEATHSEPLRPSNLQTPRTPGNRALPSEGVVFNPIPFANDAYNKLIACKNLQEQSSVLNTLLHTVEKADDPLVTLVATQLGVKMPKSLREFIKKKKFTGESKDVLQRGFIIKQCLKHFIPEEEMDKMTGKGISGKDGLPNDIHDAISMFVDTVGPKADVIDKEGNSITVAYVFNKMTKSRRQNKRYKTDPLFRDKQRKSARECNQRKRLQKRAAKANSQGVTGQQPISQPGRPENASEAVPSAAGFWPTPQVLAPAPLIPQPWPTYEGLQSEQRNDIHPSAPVQRALWHPIL